MLKYYICGSSDIWDPFICIFFELLKLQCQSNNRGVPQNSNKLKHVISVSKHWQKECQFQDILWPQPITIIVYFLLQHYYSTSGPQQPYSPVTVYCLNSTTNCNITCWIIWMTMLSSDRHAYWGAQFRCLPPPDLKFTTTATSTTIIVLDLNFITCKSYKLRCALTWRKTLIPPT